MEIKETCYKGTRILVGNEKRSLINSCIDKLKQEEFAEISIPIIQYQDMFLDKIGKENSNMMFNFKDLGDRNICLAPEYTAVIQKLSKTTYKYNKDVKLFYIQECFRAEKPQAGRYRQFTQLGVEILNPTKDYKDYLCYNLAEELIALAGVKYWTTDGLVKRGLDYYKEGKGFEISVSSLGAQKQVCGGGEYDGGIGFALGIDRLLLVNE